MNGYQIQLSEQTEISSALTLKANKKIGPWQLVEILFQIHEYKGQKPPREFKTYLREAKKFLEDVGSKKAISLMMLAGSLSENPFGFKLLRRLNAKNTSKG